MDVDTPLLPPEKPHDDFNGSTPTDNGNIVLHEPRRVIGDRGAAWLTEGWDAFKAAPGQWIGFCVVGAILLCVINLIPGINIINAFLQPVWIASVMIACHTQHNGGAIRISQLFSAFGPKAGRLIFSSIIMGICGIVLVAVVFGSMFLDVRAAEDPNLYIQENPGPFLIRALIMIALALPLYAAYWFAPALIIFSDMGAIAALKQSFAGCMKNLWPFTIYSLCLLVLGIVILIVIGLAAVLGQAGGILSILLILLASLALVPMAYSSIYLSFRDIFVD